MKTASVREVQHHLARILKWVEDGEEVIIKRRDHPIAKISPAGEAAGTVDWDEHERWLRTIFPKPLEGEPGLTVVQSDRTDR